MRTPPAHSSTLTIAKEWLFGSFHLQYDLSLPLPNGPLSNIALALLQALLEPETLSMPMQNGARSRLLDKKGRDATNSLDPQQISPPSQDELLFIRGAILPESEEEPFEVRVETKFLEFTPHDQICHQAIVRTHETKLANLSLSGLPLAVPLRLDYLRLGIDYFRRVGMFGWLARTPVVTETLLLELTPTTLRMRIVSERLKNRQDLPLFDQNLRERLRTALQSILAFDFVSDIISKS